MPHITITDTYTNLNTAHSFSDILWSDNWPTNDRIYVFVSNEKRLAWRHLILKTTDEVQRKHIHKQNVQRTHEFPLSQQQIAIVKIIVYPTLNVSVSVTAVVCNLKHFEHPSEHNHSKIYSDSSVRISLLAEPRKSITSKIVFQSKWMRQWNSCKQFGSRNSHKLIDSKKPHNPTSCGNVPAP